MEKRNFWLASFLIKEDTKHPQMAWNIYQKNKTAFDAVTEIVQQARSIFIFFHLVRKLRREWEVLWKNSYCFW